MSISTINSTDSGANSLIKINDNFTDLDTTKADLASPTFTGTPSLPTGTTGVTQSASDNSTKLATTAYADNQVIQGLSTCVTVLPTPVVMIDPGSTILTQDRTISSNTTMHVGQVVIPFRITVNKVSFLSGGTVTTPGTVDISIYDETGQTQLFSVTTASISSTGALITTSVPSVSLSPGIYYITINPNSSTNITVSVFDTENGTGYQKLLNAVTSEPIVEGTVTITANTPSAFNPSAITFVEGSTLCVRLDN